MPGYDFIILGSGPGGTAAALRAAQLGSRACLVEEEQLGGVCLNKGCIPTKALLRSARIYSQIKKSRQWGIEVKEASLNFVKVWQRKDRIVTALRQGLLENFQRNRVTILQGRGRLKNPSEVEVSLPGGETQTLRASKIILATGSSPLTLPGLPVDGHRVITSDEALRLQHLPTSILIVGGGYIGCEFGYIFHEFGVEVTQVEKEGNLLGGMDADLSKALTKLFKRSGIRVITGTAVESLSLKEGVVVASAGHETLEAEKAMVCLGRVPNTQGLGLLEAGVRVDERGYVEVDEYCSTSVPNIYAIGDITNKRQLANVAFRQAVVAVEHALGSDTPMDYSIVPSCIFTQPEVASVGLDEAGARAGGVEIKVEVFPLRRLGKAWVSGDTEGFVKVVSGPDTGRVLGVHILGAYASFLIGEAALAIQKGARVEDLASGMPVHPTFSEGLTEAAKDLLGKGMYMEEEKGLE